MKLSNSLNGVALIAALATLPACGKNSPFSGGTGTPDGGNGAGASTGAPTAPTAAPTVAPTAAPTTARTVTPVDSVLPTQLATRQQVWDKCEALKKNKVNTDTQVVMSYKAAAAAGVTNPSIPGGIAVFASLCGTGGELIAIEGVRVAIESNYTVNGIRTDAPSPRIIYSIPQGASQDHVGLKKYSQFVDSTPRRSTLEGMQRNGEACESFSTFMEGKQAVIKVGARDYTPDDAVVCTIAVAPDTYVGSSPNVHDDAEAILKNCDKVTDPIEKRLCAAIKLIITTNPKLAPNGGPALNKAKGTEIPNVLNRIKNIEDYNKAVAIYMNNYLLPNILGIMSQHATNIANGQNNNQARTKDGL